MASMSFDLAVWRSSSKPQMKMLQTQLASAKLISIGPGRIAVMDLDDVWLLAFSCVILVEPLDETARLDLPRNLVRDELFRIGVPRRGHCTGKFRENGADPLDGRNRQSQVFARGITVTILQHL